jgi:UDP-N-acetylmuramyl pentapeptide phosphotransferase/UDP-N-acetylglucosamine-1-phosphate transferase
VKDLELERARARDTMISLLCSAGVITLVGLDSQRQDAGSFANIGVIVCALVGATISGMQLRLLTKARDGRTSREYLSVGTSRQPLPRWVGVIVVLAVVVGVALLISIDFDPDNAPWWVYAALFLFLLAGLFIDLRRLRAMAKSSGNPPSATSQDS